MRGNKMNAILFHPPSRMNEPDPPLGVVYLASVLEHAGCATEVVDMEPQGVNLKQVRAILRSHKPLFVGISFMTAQYSYMKQLVRTIKSEMRDVPIIAGGVHASALPEDLLTDVKEIDYVAVGEGEKTILEFLDYLRGRSRLSDIKGLVYRKDGDIVRNPSRGLMTVDELNALPPVRWDKLYDKKIYYRLPVYGKELVPYFSLITARGCPYPCVFCDEVTIWKRRFRPMSIDRIISETEFLYNRYGARDIQILDDAFTIVPNRVHQFCDRIIESGMKIRFKVCAHVNTVDLDILRKMKQAGVVQVGYGVESGDQRVLDAIKKNQKLEDVERAFKLTKEADLLSFAYFMVGNLGEDFESVKKSAAFMKRIDPDFLSCAILTPYPGSEIYDIASKNGWILEKDWDKYVTSAHRVRNYSPIARSDKMDAKEMLMAYYYLNSTFYFQKIRRRYGYLPFLNPLFYYEEIIKRIKVSGPKRFFYNAFNLLKQKLASLALKAS